MTISSLDVVEDQVVDVVVETRQSSILEQEEDNNGNILRSPNHVVPLPDWVTEQRSSWGESVVVNEWQDDGGKYRTTHGWQGRDLVHDIDAPVRILDYAVRYGPGLSPILPRGGVGTTLTGVVHFTPRAESHSGYCHGGSMCSIMDDVIGWVAFLVTGDCRPWTGFTVQINTALKRPIAVHSVLQVTAEIVQLERRKVSVQARLVDPAQENEVHATGEGLVVLNRGVLPTELESANEI